MNITEHIKTAIEHKTKGDFLAAEKICFDLLNKFPDNVFVLKFLGMLRYETKSFETAQIFFSRAYELSPDNSVTKLLALSYYYAGNLKEAESFLMKCSKFEKTPEIYNKLINCIIKNNSSKKYGRAYHYSKYIYENYPLDIENIINFSDICLNIGKFAKSRKLCAEALLINPKYPPAWIQTGIIEEVLNGNDKEACKCFKQAQRLGAKNEAYLNLCINYSHTDYKKSNYYGKKLLKLNDDFLRDKAMYYIGTNYLKQKKMKTGYKYLLHKVHNNEISENSLHKLHDGNVLHVYLNWGGYGDMIMFARYIPFAAKKYDQIIAMCNKETINLFKYNYNYLKNIRFILSGEFNTKFDVFLSTQFPYLLNMPFSKIPYSCGYLSPPPKNQRIKEYIQKCFDSRKLKVGLCWETGSLELRELRNRSIMFNELEKLFDLNNQIQYFSFQFKSESVNKETIKQKGIIDLTPMIDDFADTAVLLANIDVLVTVDTAAAHLAGALGVKTFLLLPYYSEWRWFNNTDKTEWYDSIKIFKQTDVKSWDTEIVRIYELLMKMSGKLKRG